MDLCSLWAFFAAYVLVHWPIYKCYMGMGEGLTDFVDTYVYTMKGIVTKGNFIMNLNKLLTP